MKSSEWLIELGAIRPIETSPYDEVLVLGKLNKRHYPIKWIKYIDIISRDFNGNPFNSTPQEAWFLFGFQINRSLTKEDCERILESLK